MRRCDDHTAGKLKRQQQWKKQEGMLAVKKGRGAVTTENGKK